MCAAGPRPGWARLKFSCLSGFLLSLGGFFVLFCFVRFVLTIRIPSFIYLLVLSLLFSVCVSECARVHVHVRVVCVRVTFRM